MPQRVQAPGKSFRGSGDSPAPPVKELFFALSQKKLGPPAPLIAVLAQGVMILLKVGDQSLELIEFGLDNAHAREERRVWPNLGRCRCVRHERIMARKGYRSAKIAGSGAPTNRAFVGPKILQGSRQAVFDTYEPVWPAAGFVDRQLS